MKDTGTVPVPKVRIIQEDQRTDFTPNADEVLIVSDTQKIYNGDGATLGGIEAVLPAHLSAFAHGDISHTNRSKLDALTCRIFFGASEPPTPEDTDIWIDHVSATKHVKVYDGGSSTWITIV